MCFSYSLERHFSASWNSESQLDSALPGTILKAFAAATLLQYVNTNMNIGFGSGGGLSES